MQTNVLTKPNVSAEDFEGVPIHGRRMAASVITGSITFGLGIPYITQFLWPEGMGACEKLYPHRLVEQVLMLPIDVRWAIAAQLCYSLAADEEVIDPEVA